MPRTERGRNRINDSPAEAAGAREAPRPLLRLLLAVLAARFCRDAFSLGDGEGGVLVGASLALLAFGIVLRRAGFARAASCGLLVAAVLVGARSGGFADGGPVEVTARELSAPPYELAVLGAVRSTDHVRVLAQERREHRRQAGPARRLLLPDELVRSRVEEGSLSAARDAALDDLRVRRASWMRRVDSLEDEELRALARALVFGETRTLPVEVSDLFTRTGTRHLLAISGLHVSLLVLLAVAPLTSLLARLLPFGSERRRLRVRDALRLALLTALVYVAGAHAPVLRAATAFTVAQLGAHLPRRGADAGDGPRRADALSVWALALLGECLAAGSEPLSVSVRLSYGATLGLVLGTGPIVRALREALGLDDRLPIGSGHAAWVRVPVRRAGDLLLSGVAASLAASALTLPVVWLEFGEWSPVGLVATPLVLPLFAVCLLAAWVLIALPGALTAALFERGADLLLAVLSAADRLPGTPAVLPARPELWLAGLTVLTGGALLCRTRVLRGVALGPGCQRAAACWLALGLVPWRVAPHEPELQLLDVGHGTAALLRFPGEECWLFDAGSRDRRRVARDVVLPRLAADELGPLNVVVSHADRDHCSALARVTSRHPVRVWAGAPPAACGVKAPRDARRVDVERGLVRLPTRASAPPDGLVLTLFRGRPVVGNEGSRSLLVEWRGWRAALCGDAEADSLRTLAEVLERGPRLDLLLLPHHGSDGPHFGRLLDAARPREVWVSRSGPLPTAGELERRGLSWRSTAHEGALRTVPVAAREASP